MSTPMEFDVKDGIDHINKARAVLERTDEAGMIGFNYTEAESALNIKDGESVGCYLDDAYLDRRRRRLQMTPKEREAAMKLARGEGDS